MVTFGKGKVCRCFRLMRDKLILTPIFIATISIACNPYGYVKIGNVYESDRIIVSDLTFWNAPVSDWLICMTVIQAKTDGCIYVRTRANVTEIRGESNGWQRKDWAPRPVFTYLRDTDSLFRFEVYQFSDAACTMVIDSCIIDFKIEKNSIRRINDAVKKYYQLEKREPRGSITGRVIEQDNCMPLEDVTVLIVGTTLGAYTNKDGIFEIHDIPYGLYKVKFIYLGYKAIEVVTVIDSAQNQVKIDSSMEEEEIRIW